MKTNSLSLEQAPPAASIAGFFALGPVAVAGAGVLLLVAPSHALVSHWSPTTLALTHIGTIGLLLVTMVGALYQLLPVLLATPVIGVRLAPLVLGLLTAAVVAFVPHALGVSSTSLAWAAQCAAAAVTLFVVQGAVTIGRSRTRDETTFGFAMALVALAATVALGYLMARGLASGRAPVDRSSRLALHLTLGLLPWAGTLVATVSWQLLPMFYLSPPSLPLVRVGTLAALCATLCGLSGLALLATFGLVDSYLSAVPLLAFPGAAAIWLVHPLLSIRDLARRKRRRPDATLWFWLLGLAAGPVTLALSVATLAGDDPRWGLAFGWWAIWGWAGTLIAGATSRIVPFLSWFHLLSPHVGLAPVPSVRELLPNRHVRPWFVLQATSLVLGTAAIATGSSLAALLTGALLLATAAAWGGSTFAAVAKAWRSTPTPSLQEQSP